MGVCLLKLGDSDDFSNTAEKALIEHVEQVIVGMQRNQRELQKQMDRMQRDIEDLQAAVQGLRLREKQREARQGQKACKTYAGDDVRRIETGRWGGRRAGSAKQQERGGKQVGRGQSIFKRW